VSLQSANEQLGGLLQRQIERRSAWLKLFLAFLAALVALNVLLIKPHRGPSRPEATDTGGPVHGQQVLGEPGQGEPSQGERLHEEPAQGQPSEGESVRHEPSRAEPVHGAEEMLKVDGLAVNYYPQGSHEYVLTRWFSGNPAGRAVLKVFHSIHEAEAFPAFWALFGVFCAWVLVRLSKGSAHTFLGKSEDFYDR
jgi:hypothetical protein